MYSDTDIETVKHFLREFDGFLTFKEGLIPDTFKGLEKLELSFIHMHLNLYESTRQSLEYLFSKVIMGGIILIIWWFRH